MYYYFMWQSLSAWLEAIHRQRIRRGPLKGCQVMVVMLVVVVVVVPMIVVVVEA